MKKRLIPGVMALLFCNAGAYAQSSVTLYGAIDDGLNYISNSGGKTYVGMVNGEVIGSRWGMRGTEDLGGGLSAVFRLEGGLNLNSGKAGQGGAEFGRQAYAGLSSARYGTVTLGRQPNAAYDIWAGYTAAGSTIGDLSAHPLDNDNADLDYRSSNVVKYLSPSYHGLQGEATYAFSNATGFADNREYSLAGSYKFGKVSASAAYTRVDRPSSSTNTSGAVSPTYAFGFVGASQQTIDAAVRWNYSGLNNVAFAYSHVDVYALPGGTIGNNTNGVTLTNQDAWKFNNFELNTQYFFRPDISFSASYTFTHAGLYAASFNAANWHQGAVMLDYDLSKATSVYVQAALQHANKAASTLLGTNVEGLGRSSSENQTLVRIGMLHRF
ncbi:MAG: porin [Janthinobacterium lividum]